MLVTELLVLATLAFEYRNRTSSVKFRMTGIVWNLAKVLLWGSNLGWRREKAIDEHKNFYVSMS